MGITKTALFNDRQNQLANLFKAMGHPARIAIIEHLLTVNACICNDLVNELPLAQPTISQHLKELKQANIIQGNIEGNTICYCINQAMITEILSFINLIKQQEINNNCCDL